MNIITQKLLAAIMLCALLTLTAAAQTKAQKPFADLGSVGQLQKLFEQDKGKVRIVTLLSPT